jgi:hypothetical protein
MLVAALGVLAQHLGYQAASEDHAHSIVSPAASFLA